MKRFLFAVAVACLFAVNGFAADPPAATTTPAPAPVPVVGATTPTVITTTGTTTPTRRMGLFARLRNRMSGGTYSAMPVNTGTVITPGAGTTVPTPMPAPITKPGTGADSTGATKTITPSGVITTGGTTTTTTSGVVMADGTVVPTTMTTTPARQGLLARLRMRR